VSKNKLFDHPAAIDHSSTSNKAPNYIYFALSILRATDLSLTNLSMKFINYPAKTLIKSSRVVFTMMMGSVIGGRRYSATDLIMVFMIVVGLGLFLHADLTSNAVFHPIGVTMLIVSLTLDGAVNNLSEMTMHKFNLGQDDFQMNLYTFSFIIMLIASYQTNELHSGIKFFFQSDGTYREYTLNTQEGYNLIDLTTLENNTAQHEEEQYFQQQGLQYFWSRKNKAIALFLFSTLGIFGGSCAAAITKRFGALSMSITTTTRKAGTIFLSFAMFPNECSIEHVSGVMLFVGGLFLKALRKKIKISRIFSHKKGDSN